MEPYEIRWLEKGILLLDRFGPMTPENFRQGSIDRKNYVDETDPSPYVLILDYSKAQVHRTTFDLRLNMWSASLDPRMLYTIIVSDHTLVSTAATLVKGVLKLKLEFCKNQTDALARARAAYVRLLPPTE
ncbi:MAG: hypothetical protein R3E39_22830 [Anaerolineae bacterium]